MGGEETQIDRIYRLIMELASGNLTYRAPVSENDNELDAITVGINMLAEELENTTVSKDYLGKIYKGVVDMLFVLDKDQRITEVNNAVIQTLGFSEKELKGALFSTVLVRNEPKALDRIFKEISKRGYCHNIERSFKTKKGKTLHVSMSGSNLYDEAQVYGGTLFIAKDITKIKRTEDLLRERNEELNTFIYRASHDLKGPLASIMGLINLAKAEMQEDPSLAHAYIEMIGQSAVRLNSVLMEFLELGHITQASIKYTLINFEQLITEIMDNLRFVPGFQQVQFGIQVNNNVLYRTKRPLVKAIVQNLIENAIKYRKLDDEIPRVSISIDTDEQDIIFVITDNGIGMSKRVLDNIFKMFYRGTDRSEGTGLGLYIVQKSADALKGKIAVKSKPDQGTTVTLRIPNKLPRTRDK